MYEQYQSDPTSVDPVWVKFFQTNPAPGGTAASPGSNGTAPTPTAPPAPAASAAPAPAASAAPA
ncbi:2-oxoglutarate dehydrogenase E1 subunit family protein, partial [Nocardioides sp.]|uniref:2-oxoglutarate dehydrogenase E1 subunit family protein n=1 Tax=Nocardioides sp. TaxID=35761 RepID=UPI0039E3BF2B